MHWFFPYDAGVFVVSERGGSYGCMGRIEIIGYLGWSVIAYAHSGHDMIVVTFVYFEDNMTSEFQIRIDWLSECLSDTLSPR